MRITADLSALGGFSSIQISKIIYASRFIDISPG